MKKYFCSDVFIIARLYRISVGAFRLPFICCIGGKRAASYRDLIAYHESGVEAYAELTDYSQIIFFSVFVFEIERTAFRYCAEVVFEFFFRHAAAVVAYCDGARVFVSFDHYFILVAVKTERAVRQGTKVSFVYCVVRIRYKLAEKYLFVSVDRIYHHVEHFFRFGFKSLFFHNIMPSFFIM